MRPPKRTSLSLTIFALPLFVFNGYGQTPAITLPPGTLGPDGAYRVGGGVVAPTILTSVGPRIPDLAKKLRASGEVLLSFVVQSDRAIRDIQVIRSAGFGMDEEAVETVKKWRFGAGTKDGRPVDVRFQALVSFGIAPQPNTWGAGPVVFDEALGVTPPILTAGSMPKAVRDAGDETVVLQFIVDLSGSVADIRPIEGAGSTSLAALLDSLSTWKFAPARRGPDTVPVSGRVLLIKGKDQFRYKVASAFRDSRGARSMEGTSSVATPLVAGNSGQIITIVPKLRLEPDEAEKQLLSRVPARYPESAKLARVEGTVLLSVTIGLDGSVTDARGVSGPPELIPAAVEAVRQWKYRPTVARGGTWVATTEVEISFRLPE